MRTVLLLGFLAATVFASAAFAAADEADWVRLPSKTTAATLAADGNTPSASVALHVTKLRRLVITYWEIGSRTLRCTDVFVDDLPTDHYCEQLKTGK